MLRNIFILFFVFASTQAEAFYKFDYNKNIAQAYENILSFKLNTGRSFLLKEINAKNPNAFIFLMQNYEDFVSLCFNENPSQYKKSKTLKDKRINLLNDSDNNSPYYLLSKGIIYLQWSLIHIKYRDYLSAALDFKKSYSYFKSNQNKFPLLKENLTFYSAERAIVGTIPSSYKWISNMLGLEGNLNDGMKNLSNSLNGTNLFHLDAKFFNVYLSEFLLNDGKKSLKLLEDYKVDVKNNLLFAFAKANLEINNFKSANAINTLEKRNKSEDYMHSPAFDYELGTAYLYNSKYNEAITYLNKYINTNALYYKKDACLKIAYAYLLQNNTTQANLYKNKIKSVGTIDADADKQALSIAKKEWDDINIIKAKILFDAGRFSESIAILEKMNYNLSPNLTLEKNYRLARNYDENNEKDKAIELYKNVISSPNPNKLYFPARASLQLAYVYEEKNQSSTALFYFKKVLSFSGHEYKSSLDQKAKAGILRLTKK